MNRLRPDERGQITTALVIVGTVLVVALAMFAAKLGQATDQKSQIQIVADAASLAAAQQIRHDAHGKIEDAISSSGKGQSGSGRGSDGGESGAMLGSDAANDFADRGGADVTEYKHEDGIVTVRVVSRTNSASGSPATARAQARVGFSFHECELPPAPTPAPTPTPATTDPDPGEPGEIDCGDDLKVRGVSNRGSGHFTPDPSDSDTRGKLDRLPRPALIS